MDKNIINEDKSLKVKKNLKDDELLVDMSELFKVFGDSSRIKIINCLLESELCVSEISFITNFTPSAISHQLQILKQMKLVKTRREGKIIYYSLKDEHVRKIFEIGCEHIEEL
jgi:ArsR family transcriptional regulator